MPDAVDDYLAALAQYRHPERGDEAPAIGGAPLTQRVFGDSDVAVDHRLVAALPGIPDPFAAAMLAVMLGSRVERGAPPGPLGTAMAARLPADFAAARRFAEALEVQHGLTAPEQLAPAALVTARRGDPIGGAAWAGQQHATMAAMAAWCRDPISRRAAAAIPGLVDDAQALADRGGYAYFIAQLLGAADGVELLVLVPGARKGFVVELELVRNAAHLFALLEDSLVGPGLLDGPTLDPRIAALARGTVPDDAAYTFSIGWHYEYWFGEHPDGFAAQRGLHPLIAAMIGVEASIAELPITRGQRVILMKPRMLSSRTCDAAGFFSPLHDAQRSAVHLRRQLTADQVTAWLDELASDAAQA